MSTAVQTIEKLQRFLATKFPQVKVDGDIGKVTRGAISALAVAGDIQQVQEIISEVVPIRTDGIFGKNSWAALQRLDELGDIESAGLETIAPGDRFIVKGSFFAGPQDIRAFKKCKAAGGSDVHCFAKGDNGVGFRGVDCTSTEKLQVALPREIWRRAGKDGGALVRVWANRVDGTPVEFVATMDDTMPALDNIHNGVGIDMNPGCAVKLGIPPEQMNDFTVAKVAYQFV